LVVASPRRFEDLVHDSRFAPLTPGALFHGRYRIIRAIKAGGMGAVHEVIDEATDARRALKTMLPSLVSEPEMRARFALEAKVTGSIESDHIVRVADAGVDEATGVPFLVMDLLRGEDLRSLVDQREARSPAEVTTYLYQVALALEKTHAAGIVHRDLKPDNLFLTTRDDGSPCIKILDFGIAKVVAQKAHTQHTTQAVGTPVYMAPEQVRGSRDIGPGADVYALGHIAYALLVGEPYWTEEKESSGSTFTLFTAIVAGATEAPSARAGRRRNVSLPAGFDVWFARVTAAKPEEREVHAMDAVKALASTLGAPPPRAELPSMHTTNGTDSAVVGKGPAATSDARRSAFTRAGMGVVACLTIVALAAFALGSGRGGGAGDVKPAASSAIGSGRFQIAGDTVVDGETHLVWERTPMAGSTDWVGAKAHCARTGKGFRLPDVDELEGLYPVTAAPAVDPASFPTTLLDVYWSATVTGDGTANVVRFSSGKRGTQLTSNRHRVRCVRNGP
jgi:hypothetical protein